MHLSGKVSASAVGMLVGALPALAQAPPCLGSGCRVTVGTVPELRQAIASAPPGARILVAPGTYVISTTLDIARDDLTVEGAGSRTVFRLAPGADEPVFVLGEPIPFAPSITRRNLKLAKLTVDGDRIHQTSELSDTPGREYLRNNCVTIRQAENVVLEDLLLTSCASGGVIAEQRVRALRLTRVEARDQAFDGVAWDGDVSGSVIEDSVLDDNLFAGISFDLGPSDNEVRRVQVIGNGRVGIFVRDADRNRFSEVEIRGNGEHGVFIADGDAPGADAVGNVIAASEIAYNNGFGVLQAGERSTGNRIENSALGCNRDGPFQSPAAAPLLTSALRFPACGCTPGDATLCLQGERFEVAVAWRDFAGAAGRGHAVDLGRDDSGLFWFFDEENLELLVKVLDACRLSPGRFWVFFAATTNVGYTLTVTDTAARRARAYTNRLGDLAQATADTAAFATCP